jgi:plastocyanin
MWCCRTSRTTRKSSCQSAGSNRAASSCVSTIVLKALGMLGAGLVGLAAAVAPSALATDQTVTARESSWNTSQVAIRPGESVTFVNPAVGGGTHNLSIDGTRVQDTATNWSYTASGLSAGQHSYVCSIHSGMSGTIYVNDDGTVPAPPPPPTTTIASGSPPAAGNTTVAPPSGDGGPSGGGGVGSAPSTGSTGSGAPAGGGPGGPPAQAGGVTLVRRALGTFCVGGRGCKHPGVTVKLELAQASVVKLAVTRKRRSVGTVTKSLAAGPATIRFVRTNRGRLGAGRYRAAVTASPTAGGDPVAVGTVTFAIR